MPGLSVAEHVLGGSGPTLLMLHANGFHGRVFLPMVPLLAPHFRCVALDLPGHGDAPAPDAPFSLEDLLGA
ncbi:Pimelyl-[acyl-carrier protein] methyl ester esterase, partial [Tetrabaena socialis]